MEQDLCGRPDMVPAILKDRPDGGKGITGGGVSWR